jgi:hypothetical protein
VKAGCRVFLVYGLWAGHSGRYKTDKPVAKNAIKPKNRPRPKNRGNKNKTEAEGLLLDRQKVCVES